MEPGASPEGHFPEYDFDPDKLTLQVRVTLAADRKAVDPVVAKVMDTIRQLKCVDGKEDAIELSLQEALANAVVHGAKEDPTKIVECLVACDEDMDLGHWAGVLPLSIVPGTPAPDVELPEPDYVSRWTRAR